jgi:ABC-2 type transport system permease protein
MKMLAFAQRNGKEIVRDKLNVAFGIGFPVVVLLLLTAIQSNVPVDLFQIESLAPGVAVFGLSFISLFSGMLIAKDRTGLFMMRLFASPLKASDYILGYTIPLFPLALAQIVIGFAVAAALGFSINLYVLLSVVTLIPTALLFIGIGLLCGSIFTDKQVGGICGALLTNLSAWLSGTWFDIDLVGGVFKKIAETLPFYHAVEAARAAVSGKVGGIFPDLWWVIAYATVIMIAAILVFTHKMRSDTM